MPYVGRFAPSPTGPLHDGSLVAALASWLDARASAGTWQVRIEDLDVPRNVPGAATTILEQLARCGLHPDGAVAWQSERSDRYASALARLLAGGRAYPCACSRRDIATAATAGAIERGRDEAQVYPGTCRNGLHGRPARSIRFRLDPQSGDTAADDRPVVVEWVDRRLGPQREDVARDVGDVVLRRADGVWAYQLAVVVDDAADGITDVVRGEDLASNTARQILLQRALDLPTPRYLHVALVVGADGEKLSKQNGAAAVDLASPLAALRRAGLTLGLAAGGTQVADWLAAATAEWRLRWPRP
ncbi:MAG: tRNA glutamyl-Q(34) synthetase GluQRS [Caldimonas sp.]